MAEVAAALVTVLAVQVTSSQAALYISGHCNSSVNGVWSQSDSLFRKDGMTLYRDGAAWNMVTGYESELEIQLARRFSDAPETSEWEVWCPNATVANLTVADFPEDIYDLSAEHCGERLLFSRIDVAQGGQGSQGGQEVPRYFVKATEPQRFLTFNCSTWSWQIGQIGDTSSSAACRQWSHPREATAVCDGTAENVTLIQEFYELKGCGLQLHPEGLSNGAPFYRSSETYLSFCGRWTLGSRCTEEEAIAQASTGPPLLWDACRLIPQANLHLPLHIYETLNDEAEAVECEDLELPEEPNLEFLRVMSGGESDFLREMLIYSRRPEDIAKEIDMGFLLSQGWPFALFFLWLPFGLYLLLSSCPCFSRCRCYAKERQTRLQVKVLLFVLLSGMLGALVTCGTVASAGLRTLEDGRSISLCAAQQLSQLALEGDADFVGLRPLLRRMDALLRGGDRQGHAFEAFVAETAALAQRAAAAEALLASLRRGLAAALAALDDGGALVAAQHRCVFCEELLPLVTAKQQLLQSYLSSTPLAARRALQGDPVALQQRLLEALEVAVAAYLYALEASSFLYAEGLKHFFDMAWDVVLGALVSLAAALLMTFAMAYAALYFFAREPRLTYLAEAREYRPQTSRCSCYAWCSFCVLAMVMCATSGIIVVTYGQLGGFCLALHTELPPMDEVARRCLSGTDAMAPLRTALQPFIAARGGAVAVSDLRAFVQSHPVEALILPKAELAPRYRAMGTEPRTALGLSASMACGNHSFQGQDIPGMESFVSSVSALGAVSADCWAVLECAETATAAGRACDAAARWLRDAKAALHVAKGFRCDRLEPCGEAEERGSSGADAADGPLGSSSPLGGGSWCWRVEWCDLPSFASFVRSFDSALGAAFAALDDEAERLEQRLAAVAAAGNATAFAAPLSGGCAQLGMAWRRYLHGLCFVAVPGLRNVSIAFLAAAGVSLLAALQMYVVWRRAYDNFHRPPDRWREEEKARETKRHSDWVRTKSQASQASAVSEDSDEIHL